MNVYLSILAFLVLIAGTKAQKNNPEFGAQIGVSLNLGTHVNRVGLMADLFCHFQYIQLNFQSVCFYNFKSFGSEEKGLEAQIKFGLTAAWGSVDSIRFKDPFMSCYGNQTGRPNAISYAYLIYLDGFGTSQLSGLFALEIQNFKFIFENDFLAFQSFDKYRTGAISLQYRWKNWQFGLKQVSFTGDPYAKYCPWIDDGIFPSRSGYIDMSSAPKGNKSLGILAMQLNRKITELNPSLPMSIFNPQIGLEIGLDSERIRNLIQNKMVHDSRILPLNWGKIKNPHIPMICKDGCPYTYHKGQEIKPVKSYFNFAVNNGGNY